MMDTLHLKQQRVHKVFDYIGGSTCELCGGELEYKYKSLSENKGTIGLAYHGVEGIKITIHHMKYCTNCRADYSFGRIREKNGTIHILDVRSYQYFEFSPSTFFHVSVLSEACNLMLKDGVSMETFAMNYVICLLYKHLSCERGWCTWT